MSNDTYGFELPLLLFGGFRSIIDELHAELARRGHPDVRPAHGFALQAIGLGGATATEAGPGGVTVTFAGSGDAFGSGGRFQACIHLQPAMSASPAGPPGPPAPVLLDCGATSLPALRRCGLDPGGIAAVLVSHLHGDHF